MKNLLENSASEAFSSCAPFLRQQISLVKPRAILALGKNALEALVGKNISNFSEKRGKFFFYDMAYPVIATWHPEVVLKDLSLKRAVWEDLQHLAKFLGLDVLKASSRKGQNTPHSGSGATAGASFRAASVDAPPPGSSSLGR